MDANEIRATVERARVAQNMWSSQTFAERARCLKTLGQRLLERRDEILRIMVEETGRSASECALSELVFVRNFIDGTVRMGRKALADEPVPISRLDYPKKHAVVQKIPRGVVGVIAPWNYPLANFYKPVFPALLAGNALVIKPSEHTPRTGAWFVERCKEVLPKDLVGLVQGDGAAGEALLSQPIDAVVFTGSISTGRRVAQMAAERLIPVSLELGGNDAAIVLRDCHIDRTVVGVAQWAFHNAGQNCAAIERVLVEESIAENFVSSLSRVADALRVAPEASATEMGPLQNQAQLAHLEAHVEEAIAQGAVCVAGGRRSGPGLGYRPTVLDRCKPGMRVLDEESFGPVVAVVRVESAEQAVEIANRSGYGLNGSVWTRDLSRGRAIAEQLEVGVALVNNHGLTGVIPELPWTGAKQSGPGIASSPHCYPNFVRLRTVLVDRDPWPDPWWFPADGDLEALVEDLIQRSTGSWKAWLALASRVAKRKKTVRAFGRRHTKTL